VRDYVRRSGVPDSKIQVIHNGVPVRRPPSSARLEELRRSVQASPGERVVGMVSRFDSDFKDHPTFLRAARLVLRTRNDIRLVLVGDGPARPSMEAFARELFLGDTVVFAGYRNDARELVGAFDVSVLCSRSEGLSNVALESMAAGVPIVASAIPANVELIDDGSTGLLVPVEDPSSTAAAIQRLLDDRTLAAALGARARKVVEERFSLERQADLTMALYDRLLEQRRR
jgi:glycosyltransferase involved in cell wall biosynthesis